MLGGERTVGWEEGGGVMENQSIFSFTCHRPGRLLMFSPSSPKTSQKKLKFTIWKVGTNSYAKFPWCTENNQHALDTIFRPYGIFLGLVTLDFCCFVAESQPQTCPSLMASYDPEQEGFPLRPVTEAQCRHQRLAAFGQP